MTINEMESLRNAILRHSKEMEILMRISKNNKAEYEHKLEAFDFVIELIDIWLGNTIKT